MKEEAYHTTKLQNDLVFKYCGYEKCTPDFVQHPHMRMEYLIHYLSKGSGIYICENVVYNLSKGDIFLIPPHRLVSYRTEADDPFVFSWFAFSGTKAETIMNLLGFSEECLVRSLHTRYSLSETIETLTEMINSPVPFDDFSVLELAYSIFSKITASLQVDNCSLGSGANIIQEHIDKAKSYIKFNYMNPLTAKAVSDYVGLERSYFSKVFCKYSGKTVQNYILETRIYHAKKLLETTAYPISEISSYVGIPDPYYFSRAFRRLNGISPSYYRDNFHKKEHAT